MNVHFMGDPRGNKDIYNRIFDLVKKEGHHIISDHILNRTQEQVDKETEAESELYVKKSIKWMSRADVVVFDVSIPSVSVGFEIATALNMSKPVIVLYERQSPSLVLNALKGITAEKLQVLSYDDVTMEEILELALDYAEETTDIRFNFFVTPTISSYLDWIAKERKLPRSVYLRRLIEDDMRNNDEYERRFIDSSNM